MMFGFDATDFDVSTDEDAAPAAGVVADDNVAGDNLNLNCIRSCICEYVSCNCAICCWA